MTTKHLKYSDSHFGHIGERSAGLEKLTRSPFSHVNLDESELMCVRIFQCIRIGVFDVLPETAMDGLTPEDLRLLLNGVGDINVNLLISYTSFSDESGPGNGDKVTKIKRWLWSIVEKMTQMERMDLVSTDRTDEIRLFS